MVNKLIKRVQDLEASQEHLNQQFSKLKLSYFNHPKREKTQWRSASGPLAVNFDDRLHLNILQSLGQSVHMFDLDGYVIYWSRGAESLYGYSAAEALGHHIIHLCAEPQDYALADALMQQAIRGAAWKGQAAVTNKRGEKVDIVASVSPFSDDGGDPIGVIVVAADVRSFQGARIDMKKPKQPEPVTCLTRLKNNVMTKLGIDPKQPLQDAVASKISDLAPNVRNKFKKRIQRQDKIIGHEGGGEGSYYSTQLFFDAGISSNQEDTYSSAPGTPGGVIPLSSPDVALSGNSQLISFKCATNPSEGRPASQNLVSSNADAVLGKKEVEWPSRIEEYEAAETRMSRFVWPWTHNDQEDGSFHQKSPPGAKPGNHVGESIWPVIIEASASSSSSFEIECTNTASSSVTKDIGTDFIDSEIAWEAQ